MQRRTAPRTNGYGHALCSLREIVEAGFGKKQREWNSREILVGWRKRWAALANQYLLEAGQRELIDARAGAEFGRALDLRPAGATCRGAEDAEIAWRNGERIIAEPGLVLAALTRERSSFTRQELERFVKRKASRRHGESECRGARALGRWMKEARPA